jgi:hypothetical protein
MTEERHNVEGDEEAIEDLQAPADAQLDVSGGSCIAPSCISADTNVQGVCLDPTCRQTSVACGDGLSHVVVVYER